MSSSFTPGWNDPPVKYSVPADAQQTKQTLLSQRRSAAGPTAAAGIAPPLMAPIQPGGAQPTNFMMPVHSAAPCPQPSNATPSAVVANLDASLSSDAIQQSMENTITRAQLQPGTLQSIRRRLDKLYAALDANSLSADCHAQLSRLIDALSQNAYDQAYQLHSKMMTDFYAEVNFWMVGVKALILECKKRQS